MIEEKFWAQLSVYVRGVLKKRPNFANHDVNCLGCTCTDLWISAGCSFQSGCLVCGCCNIACASYYSYIVHIARGNINCRRSGRFSKRFSGLCAGLVFSSWASCRRDQPSGRLWNSSSMSQLWPEPYLLLSHSDIAPSTWGETLGAWD